MRLLVVDTETGGLNPQTDALLSIGGILTNEKLEEGASFEIFISPFPQLLITPGALAVNKLNPEELKENGVLEKKAIEAFQEFSGGALALIGWNVSFDTDFLKQAYLRSSLPWTLGHRLLDVQSVWAYVNVVGNSRVVFGGMAEAAKVLLQGKKVQHSALADAMMTLDLLRELDRRIRNGR